MLIWGTFVWAYSVKKLFHLLQLFLFRKRPNQCCIFVSWNATSSTVSPKGQEELKVIWVRKLMDGNKANKALAKRNGQQCNIVLLPILTGVRENLVNTVKFRLWALDLYNFVRGFWGGIITGVKNVFWNALTENYFNTSLLTIHTEFISVEDKFALY